MGSKHYREKAILVSCRKYWIEELLANEAEERDSFICLFCVWHRDRGIGGLRFSTVLTKMKYRRY